MQIKSLLEQNFHVHDRHILFYLNIWIKYFTHTLVPRFDVRMFHLIKAYTMNCSYTAIYIHISFPKSYFLKIKGCNSEIKGTRSCPRYIRWTQKETDGLQCSQRESDNIEKDRTTDWQPDRLTDRRTDRQETTHKKRII